MIEFSPREQRDIWKAVQKSLDEQVGVRKSAKIPLDKYPGFYLYVSVTRDRAYMADALVEASVKLNNEHLCGSVSDIVSVTGRHLVIEECLDQFAGRYNALERGERPEWCFTGMGVDGLISQAEARKALTSHIKAQSPQERPITQTKGQDFDR